MNEGDIVLIGDMYAKSHHYDAIIGKRAKILRIYSTHALVSVGRADGGAFSWSVQLEDCLLINGNNEHFAYLLKTGGNKDELDF